MMKKIAVGLAFVVMMSSNVFASSRNWLNKTRTIRVDGQLSDEYLKIIPYDMVETGSSIIVTVTNAKVLTQAEIDGTEASAREGGYQYSKCVWDTSKGFWDVMPYVKTNELPYRIYRRGSHTFEVRLINVPDRYTDSSLYGVNRSSGTAQYVIPLPIVGDTGGDIVIKIDNNDSSISSCSLNAGYVYEKKVFLAEKNGSTASNTNTAGDAVNVEDVTEEVSEEETETTTVYYDAGSDEDSKNDSDDDSGESLVEVSDDELISVRGVSKLLKIDDEESKLTWDGETKAVTIVYKDKTVKFTSGSNKIYVNDEKIELDEDQTAEIINDRMYVPLGILCRSLDIQLKTSFFAPTVTEETAEEADVDTADETTDVLVEDGTTDVLIEDGTTDVLIEDETSAEDASSDDDTASEDETDADDEDFSNLLSPDDIIVRGAEQTAETTIEE